MALDVKTAAKLVKFLEMMASDSDNEALTAARQAVKLIRQHNVKWPEVITVVMPPPPAAPIRPPPPEPRPAPQSPLGGSSGMGGWGFSNYSQQAMYEQFRAQQNAQRMYNQYDAMRNAYNPQYHPPPPPDIDPDIQKRDEKKRNWFKGNK